MSEDIFTFANKIDGIKNDLAIELFVFNKNYTPYSIRHSEGLETYLRPVMLYGIINDVTMGAGTGMQVQSIEDCEDGENNVAHTKLADVGRAEMLIHLIKNERNDIAEFSEQEHEFKRIIGVVAKFTNTDSGEEFYIAKSIPTTSRVYESTGLQIEGGTLERARADVSFKLPFDNQVLIASEDVYVFNMPKFAKLFQYDPREDMLLKRQIAQIERQSKLSYPEGLNMTDIAESSKKVANKLKRAEFEHLTQEYLIEQADKFELALMTDDEGAIIILDTHDMQMFANLLNDDYVDSDMSGKHYLASRKEPLDIEDRQTRLVV